MEIIRTLTSETLREQIINGGLLIVVILFGILLIRGIIKEVRTRERMENLAEELATANARLHMLDQQKTEFVSIASHQLRTPLTAIKGYSSMLLEGSFGQIAQEKMREAIDRIFDSSQRLVVIVNDLLNVSRIEHGRMKYDFNTFDMRQTAETVINETRPLIEKKGLIFNAVITNDNYKITADSGKLSQVIYNLLDNAIKYTPQGSISFEMKKNQKGNLLMSIKDTGIGIPKTEIGKLFKKFSRAKDAARTSTTGTGLGLYIVDKIIQAHKGRIWAESDGKGKGSAFYVEVPMNVL